VSASPAQSLFDALPGVWTLRREIEDERFGAGTFEGRATFATQPDGTLLYEEHGELRLGAWRGPAWRRWVYALEDDALVVRYPRTNAELHSFRFDDGSAQHKHICGADRYDASFRCLPDGALKLSYAVTGPAKNYRLRTLLRRA
jgi:hypothetical protein